MVASHSLPAGQSAAGDSAVLAFSGFTLDLRGGQLTSDGRAVPLRPKTWAVLVYLAQRPGTLISRDELLDAVWPDVAVTPDTLTKSIGELRAALGDDTRQPRYIETVHRRGFRFLDTPRPAAADGPAEESGPRPFVGREVELQQLGDCLHAAQRGARQLVFLSGVAGVGKTALVEAFLRSPALQGADTLHGLGASIPQHGEREAYMPILEALERLARGDEGARVAALLRSVAPSWLAQLPWLAGDAARDATLARPERMLREGVALLETLASELTVVLALEDLHWSDPSTIDLLTRLGQRREPARLLVLVTYRPAEVAVHEHPLGAAVRSLRGQRRCRELPLPDLSGAAVQRYLAARLPGAELPAGLAEALHRHTDGHPLFLRAVVDHMIAQGWILDTAPGWSFDAMPAQPAFGVPEDARDMVALQIGSLAPADRRVIEVAGVAGDGCTAGLLATALARPLAEVDASCETLARGERFLRAVAGVPPRYAFVHELYRQAIYDDIPASRRQRLHHAIGIALEASLGERAGEQAAVLAHHFAEGGADLAALGYLGEAAARARARAAPREAGNYLDRALALVARLPDAAERTRRELALRLELMPVLLERYGPASAQAQHNGERALALCGDEGDPDLRFGVLYALCHVHALRGDGAQLDAASAALDRIAQRLDSPAHRVLVDSVVCRTDLYRARFADCCRLADAVSAAAVPLPALGDFGSDPVVDTRDHSAIALALLGELTRARATIAAGEADASPFTRAGTGFFVALHAMLERDEGQVLRTGEAVVSLSDEHGYPHWVPMTNALRGWAHLQLGRTDAGLALLEDARSAHATAGARLFMTCILSFIAEGRLRTGEFDGGLRATDEGLRIAETTIERFWLPELWRVRGELLLAGGHLAPGEEALRRALDVARSTTSRLLALRAAVALARHYRERGAADDGRALVRDALQGFADGVAHRDLDEARALAAGPAPRRRR